MIDWPAICGVASIAGSAFLPVLKDFAAEVLKDGCKHFCKDSLKEALAKKDIWIEASAKALREFLIEFEQELKARGETPLRIASSAKSVKKFTKDPSVRLVLGEPI